jgi:hypothetical protein
LDERHEDVDAYLELMVQRCEADQQQAERRVRQVLDASYAVERKQIQQVDARPSVLYGQATVEMRRPGAARRDDTRQRVSFGVEGSV